MIAVLDYGAGNLRSVAKAFEHVGSVPTVTNDPAVIAEADGLVVPGQGSAVDSMRRLAESGLIEPIKRFVASGRPFLGVCLGEQLIFEYSEEGDGVACLGLLKGTVRRLPAGQKVPHIGWNSVRVVRQHPLLAGVPDNAHFYFVHSYYVDPADRSAVVGETEYGVAFASIVAQANVFAAQFHPEKSSDVGLQIYRNFARLCARRPVGQPVSAAARV